MTNDQREILKLQIQKRIEVLEALLSQIDSGENTVAESDNSGNTIVVAVNAQITENEKKELARLRQNITWLVSDAAGYCQQCGGDIPFARLQAMPITRLCINCAQ